VEWIRGITILLSLFGIVEYARFYIRRREPFVFAPLSWLFMVLAYTIFKWWAGPKLDYYTTSVIWSNVILIQGIIITVAALIIFRSYRPNGH
jgi:hypothetical protein